MRKMLFIETYWIPASAGMTNERQKNYKPFNYSHMQIEILDRIRKGSPDFVWEGLSDDCATEAVIRVRETYKFNQEKVNIITDLVGLLTLKDIKIEDLFSSLKKELNLDDKTANEITLIILCEILHPIKDYFPGIEDEILKLGGEVPKVKSKKLDEQFLKREDEMERMQKEEERKEAERLADTIIEKPIENLIKEYPEVGNQQIGSQKAITIEAMSVPMKPLVKYWMQDYLEKMGHFEHSNIDRVKYVYHDKNTRTMNDEERRQLNLILKSLDEGVALPYSTRMKKIDFSKIE